jgi:hypothetical protein
VSDHSNQTPKQHITCKTCGRSDMPDWDGSGHCITCARDAVLGDTPELEAALYKLADNAAGLASTGYYNHKEIKGEIDGILAAVSAELRAMVPAKEEYPTGAEIVEFDLNMAIELPRVDNFNRAIDTMITNARARGFDLQPPTKEAKG